MRKTFKELWFGYGGHLARLKLELIYAWRHKRFANLAKPTRFTEMVQVRKLTDRDPRFPKQGDKVVVKKWVSSLIGKEMVTPTLWEGQVLMTAFPWTPPYIIKSRHGAGRVIVVHSLDQDWAAIKRETQKWVKEDYGALLGEWGYSQIPRGIIVEPFICKGPDLPIDYKFYVFSGKVRFIQIHLDRATQHRWLLFERGWRQVSAIKEDAPVGAPTCLERMIEVAEILGGEHEFVRVDLYDIEGKPRFGEMTFYPGSGFDPFYPDSLDRQIGEFWHTHNTA